MIIAIESVPCLILSNLFMHYALTFRLSQLLLHPLALNELIVRISLISTDYLCILYYNIHNNIHNYPIMVRFGLDLGWIIG